MPKTKTTTPSVVPIKNTSGHDRFDDVFDIFTPDSLDLVAETPQGFAFLSKNKIQLRVRFLTEDILKFSYTYRHHFLDDPDYALSEEAKAARSPAIRMTKTAEQVILESATLTVQVAVKGMTVQILDKKGRVLSCDTAQDQRTPFRGGEAGGFVATETLMRGTTEIKISKEILPTDTFFGLGDKSGALNLRGQKLQNWNTDAFGYSDKTDPLYRAIPFFYGHTEAGSYGIFFDNTYRTHFDFDSEQKNRLTFSADGGDGHYYFLLGPSLTEVTQKFHWLTGKPELPPLWALGFHQCRWSYYPDRRVRQVAETFRQLEIPCDALYLDIDYMDRWKCFTWNHAHFPAPEKLIADLQADGFQTVVMIDPGIAVADDYAVYTEGVEKGYFLKRADGELMVGQVWPGASVFPDFTQAEARDWFGDLYRDLYIEKGVAGFWNDMNEPANFKVWHKTIPDEVRHHFEGIGASHKRVHNVYGLQMTRATTDGLKRLKPTKRPFLLTRASYAGGQRFAATWTGDNVATWEHLHLANRQVQRLNISGFVFAGSDIGGFMERPTGELMVRWLQLAVFHPFMRVHSAGNNSSGDSFVDAEAVAASEAENRLDQEPWSFGEAFTPLAKAAIELRMRLLPILYTAFWRHTRTGTPILKPLSFIDPTDKNLVAAENEFLFAEQILVSPVVKKGRRTQDLFLPNGDWYNYWTGKKYTGNQRVRVKAPLSILPLFVKAGAVLPHYPVMQFTGEKPIETLSLKVYFGEGENLSELYEDAGEGYDYQKEVYRLSQFRTVGEAHCFSLTKSSEGRYAVSYDQIELTFIGLPFVPKAIFVDGKEQAFEADAKNLKLTLSENFDKIEIKV
jgi:alpha-glucosidase